MPSSAPRGLRIFQVALWLTLAVVAAYMVLPRFLAPQPAGISGAQLTPDAPMDAPFALVSDEGKTVTEQDFAGKPSVWFYGFTNCPDICPTALAEIGVLLNELGTDAEKINAVFVTVDPERDTPSVLNDYMTYFDPRIVGLTGDLDAVTQMAKGRFVQFAKIPQGETYAMQHPAGIFLVDAAGRFAGTLDPDETMAVKLAKVRRLLDDVAPA